jgi:CubicO group peptidase (beta-lactamase class C family)
MNKIFQRILPIILVIVLLPVSCTSTNATQISPPTATPTFPIPATPTVISNPEARTDCASRYPSNPSERKNWPKEEWTVSTLEEHCLDRTTVEKGVGYLEETYNYSSVVIVRHGELVYEKYFTRSANPNRSVEIYSVTKSYLSALIGIAMDQGLLDSLDHKVIEYFPEYFTPSTDPRMKNVTLRDLLTMSVDFLWVSEDDITVAPWVNSGNMVKSAINLKFQNIPAPKPEFNYCTPNTQILSGILTKIVGEPLRSYAQRNLFTPLGIPAVNWSWGMDDQGNYLGGYGMYFRPRDIARFGYLYSSQGYWDGKQVISSEWVQESTSKKLKSNVWMDYGYLWWIHQGTDPYIFEARGSGGHMLSIIPSLDMVVVVTGVEGGDLPDPDFVIHEYFIKAVRDK